jgi:WD40 repeat protein
MMRITCLLALLPTLLQAAPPLTAVDYHPDGQVIAVGGYAEVKLIDVNKNAIVHTFPGLSGQVTKVQFSRDGKQMAIIAGVTGKSGQIFLQEFEGLHPKKHLDLVGHTDSIYGVAFSPDSKQLATAGYDRIIKIWDTTTGKLIKEMKDHSDTIYALAWHPEGKLLASGAADRAVKIWNVETGIRLYTLSDSTDWVYALAWQPKSNRLAGGGIDKSLRVWEVTEGGGRLLYSNFAHTEGILRLAYSVDGATIYSAGEGKTLKSWHSANLKEKFNYPDQAVAIQALAVRPDEKQLALARHDGSLVLLDPVNGKLQLQPLPVKPVAKVAPKMAVKAQTKAPELPADAVLKGYPILEVKEARDSARTGLQVQLPVTIISQIPKAGDADYYRFSAKGGYQLGIQLFDKQIGSTLEGVLELTDESGKILATSQDDLLGFIIPKDGNYALGIRDRDYRGGAGFNYRIHLGDRPIITRVTPFGIEKGKTTLVEVAGVNLGTAPIKVNVTADAKAVAGTVLPVTVPAINGQVPLGKSTVIISDYPELAVQPNVVLPIPGTADGILVSASQVDEIRFSGKKGEKLVIEVDGRRMGSPIDSSIEIVDATGKPVQRATLRPVARTFVTFRDHDSEKAGIRLEYWNELSTNDLMLVDGELMKIKLLPGHPDADCSFWEVDGKRVGFLDTTPTHHAVNSPMYKVEIHRPGATFPPNGMPVFQLFYRNDDGGPGYGKDSRLFFDVPADAEYRVRVRDARGEGSAQHRYRLTIRKPKPDFRVRIDPNPAQVWRDSSIPITVTADRLDGFDGPIDLEFQGLPAGLEIKNTRIEAGQPRTSVGLTAKPGTTIPAGGAVIRCIAKGRDGTNEIVHVITTAPVTIRDPSDLVLSTKVQSLSLTPGQPTKIKVTVERRNNFNGRIPLDVKGLPHGVNVINLGLNGILILPGQTEREITILAEPWVEPMEVPFVVFARKEGAAGEFATSNIMLKVGK